MEIYNVVYCVWEDATFQHDGVGGTLLCYVAGFLLPEVSQESVSIALEVSENSPRGVVTIPRSLIREFRVIEEGTVVTTSFEIGSGVKDAKKPSRKRK